MNKLKELWGNNKVLIVLGLILIACVVAIIIVTISYFFGGSSSTYGDRLKDIDKYPITDVMKKEYISTLSEDEKIDKVTIDVKGRVVYVTITYALDTPLLEAESKAAASLNEVDEDILAYYDIMFTLKCEASENSEGFTILGARNVAGSGIVWNNNTPVESEEEE